MARLVLAGTIDAAERSRLEGAGHEVGDEGQLVLRFGPNGAAAIDAPVLDTRDGNVELSDIDACLEAIAGGPTLDRQRAARLENMLGGATQMGEFVQVYVTEGKNQVRLLAEAVAAGDAKTAHRASHSLKPTSGMVGATALEAACRRLEAAARQGDLEKARGRAAAIAWLFGHAARQLEEAWPSSS